MRSLFVFLVLAGSCFGGEYAVFVTGSRLHVDRHERDGGNVRLFTNSGTIELDASQLSSFEADEFVAPAPGAEIKPADPASATTDELIRQAADHHGLPPELIHSVVAAESGYRADAISPKGAIGLMQLMPGTARELGADPHVAGQNLDAGAKYLRALLEKYDSHAELALAAYNAGPAAVDKYGDVPPYRETRDYVYRVITKYRKLTNRK